MLLGLMASRKKTRDCVSIFFCHLATPPVFRKVTASLPASLCQSLQPATLCCLVANAPNAEVATVSTSMQQPRSLRSWPGSHFISPFSITLFHPSGIFAEFSFLCATNLLFPAEISPGLPEEHSDPISTFPTKGRMLFVTLV